MKDAIHPAQARALRRMSLADRVRLNASLWEHARALKVATLRAKHPQWSERELHDAATKALQRAGR